MAQTLLQELYTPFTKPLQESSNVVKLKKVCKIGTKMEDADFWIIRNGSEDMVGKVVKKYNPEYIGVKVKNTGYDSKYIYYFLMHLHNSKYYKNHAKGTLNLKHISVADVSNASLHLKESYQPSKKLRIVEVEQQSDEDDLWHPGNIKQEFDSAKTSLNQIPSTFKTVNMMGLWQKNTTLLDIGGGREFLDENGQSIHKFTTALKSVGVRAVVFDPFNRTFEHNTRVASEIRQSGADYVTINNVLNVIQEPQNRIRVIKQAYSALKDGPDNYAFFLIYEGDKSGHGAVTKIGTWQNNMKTDAYLQEIHRYFSNVRKKGNLIIAQK